MLNPSTTPSGGSSPAISCSRCDGPGGAVTFANQACVPINGKVQCIDWCIHQLVAALTAGGVETVASCCGHGQQRGRIDLKDGRVLWIGTPEDAPKAAETQKCRRCGGSEYVLDLKSGESDPCPECAFPKHL